VLYVFGDNVKRVGLGGQAKEMRGEPNAIGVATKWNPGAYIDSYFSDEDLKKCCEIIWEDYYKVYSHLTYDKGTAVFPLDGIGTGLSRLPSLAPKVYEYIKLLGLGAQNE